MNCKLIVPTLVIALSGGLAPSPLRAQGPGGPGGPGGPDQAESSPAESRPAPKPRVRWPKAVRLPEQYRAHDTDKDGQIGMYEWPRTDFAGFRRLDLNRDGFLTPEELTRGPSGRSAAAPAATAAPTAVAVARTEPAAVKSTDSGGESPTASESAVPAASLPANGTPANGGSRSEAERFFELLDKDKNNRLTEEEFKRSFSVPKKFADAGIALTFPVGRDEFVRQYPQPSGTGK